MKPQRGRSSAFNASGWDIARGRRGDASGVRILARCLHELRTRGARLRLGRTYTGGGRGRAGIFERVVASPLLLRPPRRH
jgi:acetyl-CoA acetyltransferase